MIEELLPEGVAACSMAITPVDRGGSPPELFPVEQDAIANAVPERRIEFATGRACARQALAQFGIAPLAIPVGSDRAPVWPTGIVGSITHSGSQCFAAVARSEEFLGIGIDVEPNRPLSADVRSMVTTEAERAWLAGQVGETCWDALIFSAKECFYKVWYPVVGRWLGFEDVEVKLDIAASTFEAELVSEADRAHFGGALGGRFASHEDLLFGALAAKSS